MAAAMFASVASVGHAITIPTVPIGYPGNSPHPITFLGSVPYTYNIGKTEVTNAQYTAFLNAVAATDANSLYEANMAVVGGITRSGMSGSYLYQAVSGRENHPVMFVSFWDACRFANWLHNGQLSGLQDASTTEDGAYALTPDAISANTVTRNAGAMWALPSENEWYKAAYHQPASAGGDSDDYWFFPTSSNTVTTAQANYNNVVGYTTPVGSYAANYYGTLDMGGNLSEWNERTGVAFDGNPQRGVRGGSWVSLGTLELGAGFSNYWPPSGTDEATIGFRVLQIPSPSSVALLAIGGLAASRRRRTAGRR